MADLLFVNNINFNNLYKIKNAVNPTAPQDYVTLAFLESYIAGVRDPKDSVRVASTANVPLTGGATLTIDTISISNGEDILLKDQTAPAENGIYVASGIGSSYVLTRRSDADSDEEVTSGLYVFAREGTVNARTGWLLTTSDPIVLDTTNLSFSQIYGAAPLIAGEGNNITGNQIDVLYDGTTISLNGSNQLRIDSAYPGQISIGTLGTVTTGTWSASTIVVASGGTGATTASGARTNLGAAASGANNDITSLSGLTTALSIAQGGTGAATASGARTNLGAVGKYTTTLGGPNTIFNVAHGLDTEDIIVEVWDSPTGGNKVWGVKQTNISSTTVQLEFGSSITGYRVVVIG